MVSWEKTPVNVPYLQEKLLDSAHLENGLSLTRDVLMNMLHSRIEQIDFENAKKDVLGFIKDRQALDLWNKDFFNEIVEQIVFEDNP